MDTSMTPFGWRPVAGPSGELGESQCLELLRGVEIGRLAVLSDIGDVDIFPVNFLVDHGTVLFRTAFGRKLTSIDDAPMVAFEADDVDVAARSAWSVVVKGRASLVRRRDDLLDILETRLDSWQDARKPYFVRIVPTSTAGRRFSLVPLRDR